jgi:DTW domain-containing protein YfiP
MTAFEPRAVCTRCRRPAAVCYCAHLTSIATKTRVVLLQHPRERDMPIGTAHMAHLCLPGSELHVGVKFEGDAAFERALSDPERPAVLLYPGEGATDILASPPAGPVTLIVVDGTWWQAKKLVRSNPALAALPRYAFVAPAPSAYRIRKEPDEAYVSTIEALVHVLGALEGDAARFQPMLRPFEAMIDTQLACESQLRGVRVRHKRGPKPPPPPPLPRSLRGRFGDVVCVVAEANAWPYACAERSHEYPDELLQWLAFRPSTGEVLDVIVKPRNPLAPRTFLHTGLDESVLAEGVELEEALAAFAAFVRPTDVLCSWGRYGTALFVASGGVLPETRVDLRQVARLATKGKVGTLEEFVELLPGLGPIEVPRQPPARTPRGRGGQRLVGVASVAARFFTQIGLEAPASAEHDAPHERP